jgi:hypothetical protein
MRKLQVARNRALHKGEDVDLADAELAVKIAASLIEEIFPTLVDKVGLHTHERFVVCDDYHGP